MKDGDGDVFRFFLMWWGEFVYFPFFDGFFLGERGKRRGTWKGF